MFTAAVLTISTSGSKGERVDTSGPNLVEILKNDGYDAKYAGIVSDDKEQIKTGASDLQMFGTSVQDPEPLFESARTLGPMS